MRFLTFLGVMVGLGMFYLHSTFGTVKPCGAFEIAFVRHAPGVMSKISQANENFALFNLGRMLLDSDGKVTNDAAYALAKQWTKNQNALGCSFMVAMSEFDANKFQDTIAQEFLKAMK